MKTKISIIGREELVEVVWKLEIWYNDNYKKLSPKKRKEYRQILNKLGDKLV